MTADMSAAARLLAAESRAAQCLPPSVTDPDVLAKIATLLSAVAAPRGARPPDGPSVALDAAPLHRGTDR